MCIFKRREKKNENGHLVLTRKNILRVKVACETLLNDKSLSSRDRRKMIELIKSDADAALMSLQSYIESE